MEPAGPRLFSDDHLTTTLAPEPTDEGSTSLVLDLESVPNFFDLPATISWITENDFAKVGLQFPDRFIRYSRFIAERIEKETKARAYVLADTSYKSCCVDEVAAAHVPCDSIVHYGDSCLSTATGAVPVRYVLGRLPLNVDEVTKGFRENSAHIEASVILLTDAAYAYSIEELSQQNPQLLVARLDNGEIRDNEKLCLGRLIPRSFSDSTDSSCVLFIGDESSPLLQMFLLTFPYCAQVIHYNPTNQKISIERDTTSLLVLVYFL
ncbi:unnamed protein product, partial [Mesorhabditis spiculigera]